jgi:hypothetical protein
MVMKNGTMIPETEQDFEYLSSFRNGDKVSVVITKEIASWRRRKYWAILALVIKTCPLPKKAGSTNYSLHDAICREAGYVDAHSSDGKTLTVRRQKTSKFDDRQFEAFYHDAMEVLREWTGLDAETLNKESADVGQNEQESQEASPPPEATRDVSGDDGRPPVGPAPEESEMQPPAGETFRATQDGGMEAASETGQSTVGAVSHQSVEAADHEDDAGVDAASSSASTSAIILNLKAEAVDKFLQVATNAELDVKQRRDVLEKTKEAWKAELRDHPDFVKACLVTADKVIKGQMPVEEARKYLSTLVR